MRFQPRLHGSLIRRTLFPVWCLRLIYGSPEAEAVPVLVLELLRVHAVLSAHIVANPDHVHPHLNETLCGCEVVLIGNVEYAVCQLRIHDEIHEKLFEPAQGPGGFKNSGDCHSHDSVLVPERIKRPPGLPVQFIPPRIGWRVAGNRMIFGKGMVRDLCVSSCTKLRFILDRSPADAPLIRIAALLALNILSELLS